MSSGGQGEFEVGVAVDVDGPKGPVRGVVQDVAPERVRCQFTDGRRAWVPADHVSLASGEAPPDTVVAPQAAARSPRRSLADRLVVYFLRACAALTLLAATLLSFAVAGEGPRFVYDIGTSLGAILFGTILFWFPFLFMRWGRTLNVGLVMLTLSCLLSLGGNITRAASATSVRGAP